MTGTRMLQRRGTAAEWAEDNPILGDGEIGWERDTHIIKIGDGITAWNALQEEYLPFKNSEFLVPGKLTVESALTSIFKQPGVAVGVQFEPNGFDTNLVVRSTGDGTAKITLATNQIESFVPLILQNNIQIHGPNSGLRIYARDNDGIDFELYMANESFQLWCAETETIALTIDRFGNLHVPGAITDGSGSKVAKTGDTMVGYYRINSAFGGGLGFNPGDGGHTGYTEFFLPSGPRGGYIGYIGDPNGDIQYQNEVGGHHVFLNDIFSTGTVNDGSGRVYSPGNPDITRVAKAGDTMTGSLVIVVPAGGADTALCIRDNAAGGKSMYIRPRAQAVGSGIEFVNSIFNAVVASLEDSGKFTATGPIFEGGNRVYSAANPPPGGSGGSSINQTQRGTVSIGSGNTSATVTITTVNMAKTQLRYLGSTSSTGDARIELTSATVITATRSTTTPTIAVGYDLTEWT